MQPPTKYSVFPIIRLASLPITGCLLRLPISANIITTVSLTTGLVACYLMTFGTYQMILIGSFLFLLCYIFDNADGEIARAKNQCSSFGDKYDTFVDWIVHAFFFFCLGWGTALVTNNKIWLLLGISGTLGGTINYIIGLLEEPGPENHSKDPPEGDIPVTLIQWFVFIFRELFRADFCFIVIGLALFGFAHYLLPLAAIGAHAYWITRFVNGSRRFHV